MTVSTSTSSIVYPVGGSPSTTVFPFPFPATSASELVVVKTLADGTTQTLTYGSDYTVTLGTSSGTVTLPAALGTSGLTIARVVPLTQPATFPNEGAWFPENAERALDRMTMQIQQQQEELNRCMQVPLGATTSTDLPLPVAAAALGWDITGTELTNLPTTQGAYNTALGTFGAGEGDALLAVKATESGSVQRTQHQKNSDTVNAADFGFASAASASTNATAFANALATGKEVTLPAGTFDINTISWTLAGDAGVRVRGAGVGKTILRPAAGQTKGLEVTGSGGSYNQYAGSFSDFTIDMANMSDSASVYGIYLNTCWGLSFRNVNVKGYGSNNWSMFCDNKVYTTVWDNCDFGPLTGRIKLTGAAKSDAVTTQTFIGCSFAQAQLTYVVATSFYNCIIQGELDKFIFESTDGIYLSGCDIEGKGTVYTFTGSDNWNFKSIGNEFTGMYGPPDGYYLSGMPTQAYLFCDSLYAGHAFRVGSGTDRPVLIDLGQAVGGLDINGSHDSLQRIYLRNISDNANSGADIKVSRGSAGTDAVYFGVNQITAIGGGQLQDYSLAGKFTFISSGTGVFGFTASAVRPHSDGGISCGTGALRWSVVYAATGTINTSDEREKQDIRAITAAEKAVADRIRQKLKAFRFRDAVAKKGTAARVHFGVIAQDVEAAFKAEGLNPEAYGVFCRDRWADEHGNTIERLGVRYEELIAFLMAS